MLELRKKLQKAYPLSLYSWKKSIAISGFIALFLFVFQPFGLRDLVLVKRIWIVFGYGMVTFLIMIFHQFLLPQLIPSLFREKHWTILKQLVWNFWNLFLIAIGNFYFSASVFDIPTNQAVFLQFLLYTFLTGALPIAILIIIHYNKVLNKNLRESALLNEKLSRKIGKNPTEAELVFSSANEKEYIQIPVSKLVFVESSGNYVIIRWEANNKLQEKSLRNTLTNIEKQVETIQGIFRTHKAFIVNLNQVKRVHGNAQGYKLDLNFYPSEVPVSRANIKKFNAAMASQ